ncbi:three-Cys-motif partner protein TcmP [Aliarcobacter butzleri]|uniref:three-Cys-motif partner protein TcmP n=1 Tax=Aliarcobacter butzleri TaxID=28197 RepID=UPI00263C6719|nr:three-Cys-motif partner protein TcmP [Aliarcobacter butzleri]MDN5101385.1 three-Cys-motif partner protein TcmP [Aliarcobacter butzleri]
MAKVNKYNWCIGEELPTIEDHSKVKLDIIENYLEIYLRYLTKGFKVSSLKLDIIDGFCGGGIYSDGTTGSPIRIKETIEKTKKIINFEKETSNCKTVTFDIKYTFIEKNRNTFLFLKKTLNDYSYLSEDTNCLNGKFISYLDAIIENIKNRSRANRCIFILDQYGYADAPIPVIKKIFEQLPKAEVILTFSVDSLIDYLSSEKPQVLYNMGLSKEDCEQIYDVKEDNDFSRTKIQPLLYKTIVNTVNAPFYTPFFIKSDVSSRAYWLFHFSTHAIARDEMMKIHWKNQNTFVHHAGAGLNMFLGYDSNCKDNLFNHSNYTFDDLSKEKSIQLLSCELPKIIQEKKCLDFNSLNNLIANETPVTRDIIRESLANSIESGEIKIVSKDNNQIRRKHTTIQDKDIIKWTQQRQISFLF